MRTFPTAVASTVLAMALCSSAVVQAAEQQIKVRGKIVGVTSIGEAVIDPASRKAIVAKVDYLTVLGSPVGEQERTSGEESNQAKAENGEGRDQTDSHASQGRDNIYIVAITPQTTVRASQGGRREDAQQTDTAAFKTLEIGDQVEVALTPTGQMSQEANAVETRTSSRETGAADKSSSAHGRNRVFIGRAKSITVLSGSERQQRSSDETSSQERQSNDH